MVACDDTRSRSGLRAEAKTEKARPAESWGSSLEVSLWPVVGRIDWGVERGALEIASIRPPGEESKEPSHVKNSVEE